MMNLRLVQSVSDRIADTTGLRSLLVSARASGSSLQLRSQVGGQYDTSKVRFGVAMRTPGVTLRKTGSAILDGVLDVQPGSLGASLFDPDARLEYHLPWEFQGGAALVTPRVEVELDVQGYTSIGAYPLLSSSEPVLTYGDAGANVPPIVMSRPFGGLTSHSNAIVNVGAGGHVRLLKDRDVRLHAGVGSNRSPVGSDDVVFNKANLTTWSVGVSGAFARLQFAVGLNHQGGTAEDVVLRNLLNGRVVQSSIDVNITGFIYSLGYQF